MIVRHLPHSPHQKSELRAKRASSLSYAIRSPTLPGESCECCSHPHFASVGQDLARLGKTFEKYPEVLITVINCTKGQFGDVMTDKGETICGEYLGSETVGRHC